MQIQDFERKLRKNPTKQMLHENKLLHKGIKNILAKKDIKNAEQKIIRTAKFDKEKENSN